MAVSVLLSYTQMVRGLILFLILSFSSAAFAAEIRIQDTRGLLRATKKVPSQAAVTVQLDAAPGEVAVVLANVDGLKSDISGTVEGVTCRFRDVGDGTWKVKTSVARTVQKVTIEAQS